MLITNKISNFVHYKVSTQIDGNNERVSYTTDHLFKHINYTTHTRNRNLAV